MIDALAIVQARSSSTRLPGKVLAPIAGEPMIIRQLERIERAHMINRCVVATSEDESDDQLVSVLESRGVRVFRGSLSNVLSRFIMVADDLCPANIVRLTADCPLTDPDVIDLVVQSHFSSSADYSSNALERTFPHGLDVETVRTEVLRNIHSRELTDAEREHVTLGVYSRPDEFSLHSVTQAVDLSNHRWTVDYPADLEFARAVYDALYLENPAFTTADILKLLRDRPGMTRTAADVT